jgi:acetyl esterase
MDPQVMKLLDMLRAALPPDAPRLWQLPVAEARRLSDAFLAMFNEGGPKMAETRVVTIPGSRGAIPARLYVPNGASARSAGLLYLHGGGFVIGSSETHDRLTRELADGIGARVLSLDYALAPEHPYPAGLDDCVDAAGWLHAHGTEVGIDPGRLLIGGDSAGASLSAAAILRLQREKSAPTFRAALLLYGHFTYEETGSIQAWGDRDLILSKPLMDWFRTHYVGDRGPRADPYLEPLAADLRSFPPSVLVVGTLDPLLDDSRLFAAALEKAGVSVELHVYPDGLHAFMQMLMLDMAKDAVAKVSAFARRCVASQSR